jgi:hypothetical protein
MSFTFGTTPSLGGVAGAARFATRGRIGNGAGNGLAYPHPFFDLAHTYLPATMQALFHYCRYYFLTNPLINIVSFKMAQYPVTDIIVDSDSSREKKWWTEYLQDHLRWRAFQVEVGLDYNVYGNGLVSISYPFIKHLKCSTCGLEDTAEKLQRHWVYTNHAFRLSCPKCLTTGDAIRKDVYIKNESAIRLLRWNVEDIRISYHAFTGEEVYFYKMPPAVRNDILLGRKEFVQSTPEIYLQAVKDQKDVVLNSDQLFHMRKPTLAQYDRGWGIPPLMPVLKDAFYRQIMKKANETILTEAILPLRALFPQAGSGAADVYTSVSINDWRDAVAQEIAHWRRDPNYIPILPLPIGMQVIGGEGKALLLTAELRENAEEIVVGMGAVKEFVWGGAGWSGTQVSMRMIEQGFLGDIIGHRGLLNFSMRNIGAYLEREAPSAHFKPFKMVDDLQRKAYNMQLNQAGGMSLTTLMADSDYSLEDELALSEKELAQRMAFQEKQQIAMAKAQGEVGLVQARYQARAQALVAQAQQQPQDAMGAQQMPADANMGQSAPQFAESRLNAGQNLQGNAGVDLLGMAQAQAAMIASQPPDMQTTALANLRLRSPELADLTKQFISRNQAMAEQQAVMDARLMPEQRAPRRAGG